MKKQHLTKKVDKKEYLQNLLEQFSKLQIASKQKIEKYEDMMKRKSSQSWDDKKKKKSEARLEQAKLEYSQSFEIIEQIKQQLSSTSDVY